MLTATVEDVLKWHPCKSKQEISILAKHLPERFSARDIMRCEEIDTEDKIWTVLREELTPKEILKKFVLWNASLVAKFIHAPEQLISYLTSGDLEKRKDAYDWFRSYLDEQKKEKFIPIETKYVDKAIGLAFRASSKTLKKDTESTNNIYFNVFLNVALALTCQHVLRHPGEEKRSAVLTAESYVTDLVTRFLLGNL